MSNSPQRQRGFPQQHPGMYPQQMYPPQAHEGYGHGHPPPTVYPGGPPQGPPPPHYGHPAGTFPPYGYGAPPGGYPPQSYYPPPGGPYGHGYPQQPPYPSPPNVPGPMGGPASANQFMNNNKPPSSSPKNGKISKSDRKQTNSDSNSPTDYGTVKSAISSTSRFNNNRGNNNDYVSQVSPMRSDFHFFAEEHKKEAVMSIDAAGKGGNKTAFQSVTELNERLMSMWEKAPTSERNSFMVKEEADRERFMNEDEIESRHCATLTSRTRPLTQEKPERVANVVTKDEDEDQSDKVSGSKRQVARKDESKSAADDEDFESPTKKVKEDEKDQTTENDSTS